MPENPRGWLAQTATRRLIDQWRSDQSRRNRERLASEQEGGAGDVSDRDDSVIVLFMCCHPVLTPASAVALTLRAAGGLTTAEIANAFLVDEATMAQRISRAKQRIRSSGIPFEMPSAEEQKTRQHSVLRVLYLIFNEGYTSSVGSELQRVDLTVEAMRLTRLAQRMLPDDAEVTALLALMLLLEARSPARTDGVGNLVPLAEQDRALWDQSLIADGIALLSGVMGKGGAGEYKVQAAIAALHDQAPTAADTDWLQILGLYSLLEQITGNPVVTLNKAVAAAMANGPAAGLELLEQVEETLNGHYRLHAVRAHLLEMAGDTRGALADYRTAADRTTNLPEQRYLTMRVARLRS